MNNKRTRTSALHANHPIATRIGPHRLTRIAGALALALLPQLGLALDPPPPPPPAPAPAERARPQQPPADNQAQNNGQTAQTQQQANAADRDLARLGRRIFFDRNLSSPPGLACATCHSPDAGLADPANTLPTSEGAVAGRFGSRNAPTAGYAAYVPRLRFDRENRRFSGGLFVDGRADSLEEQAKVPLTNPLEMNNPDASSVIRKISRARYANEFLRIFGDDAFADPEQALDQLAEAIAAFERTEELSPFTSKFDAVAAGLDQFSPAEERGRELFFGDALCSGCHDTEPPSEDETVAQVFSNFRYFNLGVPANPDNPFYSMDASFNPDGTEFVDHGLGDTVGFSEEDGKFRVPTLRNIRLTGPYMHNGVFQTLDEVVRFYNRRDVDGVVPEVAENSLVFGNFGDLGLTPRQERELVAFMETLTDGYFSR